MSDQSPVPDWLGSPDVVLLRDVATAVVRLDGVGRLDAFTLPYPAEAQRALDALVLACLRTEARPPSGLPELIRWSRTRPLGSWPLDRLPEGLFTTADRLIDADSGEPTQLCHELAVKGLGDSTARQYDRLVIREAMRACRDASSPESYTAFRRLLVMRPVLTEAEWAEISSDLYLDPVRFLIEEIYAPAPVSHRNDGACLACARCLTLLTPLAEGGWWCERDQCRYQGPPPHGRLLAVAEVGRFANCDVHYVSSSRGLGGPRPISSGNCEAWDSLSRCGPATTRTTSESAFPTATSGRSMSRTGLIPGSSAGPPKR